MNRYAILGIVAFGGLMIVATLNNTPETSNHENQSSDVSATEIVIPADFGNQFPVYPGSVVASVRESETESSRDVSLSLDAEASIADINDWYRDALSQNGWNIKSDKNVAGYQIIQAEHKDLYTSLQAANGENGTVRISQHLKIRTQ